MSGHELTWPMQAVLIWMALLDEGRPGAPYPAGQLRLIFGALYRRELLDLVPDEGGRYMDDEGRRCRLVVTEAGRAAADALAAGSGG